MFISDFNWFALCLPLPVSHSHLLLHGGGGGGAANYSRPSRLPHSDLPTNLADNAGSKIRFLLQRQTKVINAFNKKVMHDMKLHYTPKKISEKKIVTCPSANVKFQKLGVVIGRN